MNDYTVLTNVFPDKEFQSLKNYLKRSVRDFKPFDVGYDHNLYFHMIPRPTNETLNKAIEAKVGKFQEVLTFARLNTPDKNTEFRVHSDSKIFGKQPNLAAVFYIESSEDSGTAFFKHPEYGDRFEFKPNQPQIIPKDDGLWEKYYQYNAVENTMLLYNAHLYHGRQPWVMNHERIVIVKFMIANVDSTL
jgi:hypothetical protein